MPAYKYVVCIRNVAMGVFHNMEDAKKSLGESGNFSLSFDSVYHCNGTLTSPQWFDGVLYQSHTFTITAVRFRSESDVSPMF